MLWPSKAALIGGGASIAIVAIAVVVAPEASSAASIGARAVLGP